MNPTTHKGKIFITEHQKKLFNNIILAQYQSPQPIEWELADYYVIDREYVGSKYHVFVDESKSYKRYNHPLWVYVETNIQPLKRIYYGRLYIPITVEKEPRIIGDIRNLHVSVDELVKIQNFIAHNVSVLKKIANQKIRRFDDFLFLNIYMEYMNESRMLLTEMGNFFKKDTGLPVNVWLDPGWAKPHAERIKVQNNLGNNITPDDFISVPLFDDIDIVGTVKLDTKQLFLVNQFIKHNRHNLLLLQRKLITEDEFKARIIKVDSKGNAIYVQNEDETSWRPLNGYTTCGFTMVIANNKKFNFINDKNEILSSEWFDKAGPFQREGDECFSYVSIRDVHYKLNSNGDLKIFR
jgi:hypothetical protein